MALFRRRLPGLLLLAGALLALCAAVFAYTLPPRPVSFVVGGATYVLAVTDADAGAPQVSAPDVRPLRTRTVVSLPLSREKSPLGALTLTLDETAEGTVFYLESNLAAPVTIALSTPAPQEITARAAPYGASAAQLPHALALAPYDADSALYFEGGAVQLYLSRLARLADFGQTVYRRTVPPEGVSAAVREGVLTLSIPLPAGHATCAGVATEAPLVHWGNASAPQNVWNLDCSDIDYHLLADGVYIAMPETYRPREGTDPHIYRAATAWLLGPCTYPENGAMFTALGKSILYTYLDRVNAAGFLPTQPSSTWLSAEYGIGAGFYDTRFNFDTMKRLMRAETQWDDPAIGETVRRMTQYFLDFSADNRFEVDDVPFVPDYGAPADARDAPPSGAACSLNHYLSEGLLLLRAGQAYGDELCTARGTEILDAINDSAARWLRPSGDLWYAIRPDGQMEKDDYLRVTYLDLVDASALLHKLGVWEQYEGVQALLASKEEWLIDTGHRDLLAPHAAFTAFS